MTDYKKALEGRTIKEVRCCDDSGLCVRLDNGEQFGAWVFYNSFEEAPFVEYELLEPLFNCPEDELMERER